MPAVCTIRCIGYDRNERTLYLSFTPTFADEEFAIVLPVYLKNLNVPDTIITDWSEVKSTKCNIEIVTVIYQSLIKQQAINEFFRSENIYDLFERNFCNGDVGVNDLTGFERFLNEIQRENAQDTTLIKTFSLNLTIITEGCNWYTSKCKAADQIIKPGNCQYKDCSLVLINERNETLYLSEDNLRKSYVIGKQSFVQCNVCYGVRYRGFGIFYFIKIGEVTFSNDTFHITLALVPGQLRILDATAVDCLPDNPHKYTINVIANQDCYKNQVVANVTLGEKCVFVLPLTTLQIELKARSEYDNRDEILVRSDVKIITVESMDEQLVAYFHQKLKQTDWIIPQDYRSEFNALVVSLGRLHLSLPVKPLQVAAQLIHSKPCEEKLDGADLPLCNTVIVIDSKDYVFDGHCNQAINICEGRHNLCKIKSEYRLNSVTLITDDCEDFKVIPIKDITQTQNITSNVLHRNTNYCGALHDYCFDYDFTIHHESCHIALILNVMVEHNLFPVNDILPRGFNVVDIAPIVSGDRGKFDEIVNIHEVDFRRINAINYITFKVGTNHLCIRIGNVERNIVLDDYELDLDYLENLTKVRKCDLRFIQAGVYLENASETAFRLVKVLARYFDILYFLNLKIEDYRDIRAIYTELKLEYDHTFDVQNMKCQERYRYAVKVGENLRKSTTFVHPFDTENKTADPYYVVVDNENTPTDYLFQEDENSVNVLLRVKLNEYNENHTTLTTELRGFYFDTSCIDNPFEVLQTILHRFPYERCHDDIISQCKIRKRTRPVKFIRYILKCDASKFTRNIGKTGHINAYFKRNRCLRNRKYLNYNAIDRLNGCCNKKKCHPHHSDKRDCKEHCYDIYSDSDDVYNSRYKWRKHHKDNRRDQRMNNYYANRRDSLYHTNYRF
jgi:hypothetical protein